MPDILHEGIVLRTYVPHKQKIVIFDDKLGKIEALVNKRIQLERMASGFFLSYTLEPCGIYYLIKNSTIIDSPTYWAQHNILFFHHIMELCFFFLPLESQAADLFNQLKVLYTHPEFLQDNFSQKVFLYYVFKYFGVYPPEEVVDLLSDNLILNSVNSKLDMPEKEDIEDRLYQWLSACVYAHPQAHTFKTIDYLKKTGSL